MGGAVALVPEEAVVEDGGLWLVHDGLTAMLLDLGLRSARLALAFAVGGPEDVPGLIDAFRGARTLHLSDDEVLPVVGQEWVARTGEAISTGLVLKVERVAVQEPSGVVVEEFCSETSGGRVVVIESKSQRLLLMERRGLLTVSRRRKGRPVSHLDAEAPLVERPFPVAGKRMSYCIEESADRGRVLEAPPVRSWRSVALV